MLSLLPSSPQAEATSPYSLLNIHFWFLNLSARLLFIQREKALFFFPAECFCAVDTALDLYKKREPYNKFVLPIKLYMKKI